MMLGMILLSPYFVVLECNAKIINLEIPGGEILQWGVVCRPKSLNIILFL